MEALLGWQMVSSLCFWSAKVGPAGRRREASFGVGLARSLAQWGSARFTTAAGGFGAACLRDSVSRAGQGSAAWGGVDGGEMFEGADERASQGRCVVLGDECAGDAGGGLAARLRC